MEQQKQVQAAPKTKQPWRKPAITFVPLQVTALESGTVIDAESGNLI